MTDFDKALKHIFKWEGGYVNDPKDPGGETKFGISKRAYPDLNIKELSEKQAELIYRLDYWDKAGCDKTSYPLNIVVFDTAVNMGISRAIKFRNQSEYDWKDYLLLRVGHYVRLGKRYPQYLRGWLNRVMDLYETVREE
jgi:lysozyme family protein